MISKKLMILGLAAALVSTPFLQTGHNVLASTPNKAASQKASADLTDKGAVKLAADFAKAASYVQMGGSYKEGEYKSFELKGKTYRYLSSDIDTMPELLKYLKRSLTHHAAAKFIKEHGIIEHKGKLAQIEADGGSLLQWEKAVAEFVKMDKKVKVYRLVVPVGESKEKAAFIVRYHQYPTIGWRISSEPSLDLNVPFNVNPAALFFNHLLVNVAESKKQFLNPENTAWVDEFKKGIKKVELRELKEVARSKAQVEYSVKFYVELESGYKGSLNAGENKMFFLLQPVGDYEFKIASYGTAPHLLGQ